MGRIGTNRGVVVIALAALSFTLHSGTARAQSSGPNNPTTIVDDASVGTGIWNFTANAAASDNAYAQAPTSGVGSTTHYLKATGFGFAIPVGAVINGIRLTVEKRSIAARPVDNAIRIVKGGVIGATDRSDAAAWPTTDTVVTYGSSSDLWGQTWTAADINSAGFGAAISARQNVSGLDTAGVDHITLTVFYSLCGDGNVGGSEDCDDGGTVNGDCCSSTCLFEPSSVVCRAVTGGDLCDEPEFCTGGDGTCPPDSFSSPTVECRSVTPGDVCDEPEFCTGVGPECPTDSVQPGGECRAANGDCDLAESCDGVSKSCPGDAFKTAGVPCAEDGTACTTDTCNGSGTCTHVSDGSCGLITGRLMVVKPSKLAKFVSKGTFVLPPGSDNPLTEGGSIRFLDTGGFAGDVSFSLPAAGWKALGNPAGSKGYKYKGAGTPGDPCKVVLVKPKVIKAVCKGTDIMLTPPYSGTGAAVLRVGSATTRYCVEFLGTNVKNTNTVFKRKNAPAPAQCAEAVPTFTPANTHTPTPTRTPINTLQPTETNTATPTRTDTPPPGPSFTPTNTRTPSSTRTPTATPLPIHECNFDGATDNSQLQICFLGVCPAPNDISGQVNLTCDPLTQDGNGKRDCQCELVNLDPFQISGVGTVCVTPSGPCPDGELDCDGGNSLDVDTIAETNAGACTSNAGCATQCSSYCSGIGKAVFSSGCESFCQGGSRNNLACQCDTLGSSTCAGGSTLDCPGGSCEGKDNEADQDCHCQCIDEGFGGASAAGTVQCRVGVAIRVEADPVCDNVQVLVRLPPLCAPFTSASATARILNTNENTGTTLGPYTNSGTNESCTNFDTDVTTGYTLVSNLAFFDSTIGDLIARLTTDCQ